MTNPKHALATQDSGRYYAHPVTGQMLISVTNVLGECMHKSALVPWAAKASNDHAWDVLPRMVAALRRPTDCRPAPGPDRVGWEPCGRCRPCIERESKGHHAVIRDTAADLGSRIHAHAEARVTGAAMLDDPEVEPYVEQYLRFLSDFEVDIDRDVESAELTVADPRVGYAGTLDLLVRLRLDGILSDGKPPRLLPDDKRALWLVDFKTSATKPSSTIYDEHALQLAGLRFASEMWLPDDTVAPMPRGITGTAVLNLRTDTYGFIPVPTGTAERRAFHALVTGATWRHSKPTAGLKPVGPDGKPTSTTRRTRVRKAA